MEPDVPLEDSTELDHDCGDQRVSAPKFNLNDSRTMRLTAQDQILKVTRKQINPQQSRSPNRRYVVQLKQ